MTPTARTAIERGLAELRLEAAAGQLDALVLLAERVADWGERVNLTGHRGPVDVARRLVLDAAALLQAAPPCASLADLGSGAGFPGLPIAILRPDIPVTLVEARQRRHHFQRAVCRELGLENVTTLRGRAEALAAKPHAAVVAQAMAQADRALGWMLPWAEPRGWLWIPGGAEAPNLEETAAFYGAEVRRYAVPEAGPQRTLWIARRAP
ncbi:MAG: 16S rRNA (guanine(527)-N(7))-methyltransferase RsmG [Myxococcota bacterium]|nr:16S rRNA (guanine(527)-N(7))-methyltransferase RsmG [Myxococcota bacterium]